jgi:signal transduction histidine kinase/ActR/RegA family two-component response regulator
VTDSAARSFDERFLVLAPTGRDAKLTCTLLERAGVACAACSDMDELCSRLEREGAAGLLLAEEVLVKSAFTRLVTTLQHQESWSDVPILLFTASHSVLGKVSSGARALAPLGSVTLLERPVRPITMLSAANAALRARRRQYMAREELFAQQRAVRQRDEFLAMLGHELRNPLAAIALANRMDDGSQTQRRSEVIGRQVRHLTCMVDDLLDVSRVTSGKVSLRRKQVAVCEIVDASIRSAAAALQKQSQALRVERPEQSPLVFADPVRLEQVIVNLLINASKYTPAHGKVHVSVEVEGEMVLLQVRDTGVGIAADMLEHVFDLFAQVEGSLDRAKGGLGIGLTLVRSLVELHGGSVRALSPGLGCGSTFQVRLPLASPMTSAADGDVLPRVPAANAKHQILIVEDNADSRELLTLILERLGHRVYAAADGPSGVSEALELQPDVLLIDIGLPGLDGYAVARHVRAALGHQVYLIALTGYGQPEDRRRAFDAGFDAHFSKPVDIDAIDRLLSQHQLGEISSPRACSF